MDRYDPGVSKETEKKASWIGSAIGLGVKIVVGIFAVGGGGYGALQGSSSADADIVEEVLEYTLQDLEEQREELLLLHQELDKVRENQYRNHERFQEFALQVTRDMVPGNSRRARTRRVDYEEQLEDMAPPPELKLPMPKAVRKPRKSKADYSQMLKGL